MEKMHDGGEISIKSEDVEIEAQSNLNEMPQTGQTETAETVQVEAAEERSVSDNCTENGETLIKNEENIRTIFAEMCAPIIKSVATVAEKISTLEKDMAKVITGMNEIQGYRDAVSQLKVSLLRNQQNEERIYKDLEIAKKDEKFVLIKPLLESIISIHTELLSSRLQYETDRDVVVQDCGEKAYKEIIGMHEYQMKNIEGILQIHGVELIWYMPDTSFEAMKQTISKKTELTEDVSKKDFIARTEMPCYCYNDKILRKAKVVMYKVTT